MTNSSLETLYFDSRGVKLHAVAAGPAEGPVVILLHGFPEFWKCWTRQINSLARAGYRVIALDQRGYHLSDKPESIADYRLDHIAGDVLNIIDKLAIERVYIAGHDFGASVTWWLLLFHPDRFHAAAILNVPHPRVMQQKLQKSFGQMIRSWYMFFFQLPRLPEWWFSRRGMKFGVQLLVDSSRSGTFSPEDLSEYKKAWSTPGAVHAMIQWYRAAFRYGIPSPTPTDWKIRTPVLILWGQDDRFLSAEMANESARYCTNVKCVVLPGVSHWIHHEQPVRVADELLAHFSASKVDRSRVKTDA